MKLFEPIVPIWRFVAWGVITAVAVATLGWVQREPHLFIFAPVAGIIISSVFFLIQWSRSHQWVLQWMLHPLLWLSRTALALVLAWIAVRVSF